MAYHHGDYASQTPGRFVPPPPAGISVDDSPAFYAPGWGGPARAPPAASPCERDLALRIDSGEVHPRNWSLFKSWPSNALGGAWTPVPGAWPGRAPPPFYGGSGPWGVTWSSSWGSEGAWGGHFPAPYAPQGTYPTPYAAGGGEGFAPAPGFRGQTNWPGAWESGGAWPRGAPPGGHPEWRPPPGGRPARDPRPDFYGPHPPPPYHSSLLPGSACAPSKEDFEDGGAPERPKIFGLEDDVLVLILGFILLVFLAVCGGDKKAPEPAPTVPGVPGGGPTAYF